MNRAKSVVMADRRTVGVAVVGREGIVEEPYIFGLLRIPWMR
jgi:hypothetical protein